MGSLNLSEILKYFHFPCRKKVKHTWLQYIQNVLQIVTFLDSEWSKIIFFTGPETPKHNHKLFALWFFSMLLQFCKHLNSYCPTSSHFIKKKINFKKLSTKKATQAKCNPWLSHQLSFYHMWSKKLSYQKL